MFGKIKKVFFTGIFGILYVSFVAQLVYVLGWVSGADNKLVALAVLSLEWLVLIAARYLSKRSSNSAQHNGFRRR
jgi:Flp pilus assembly protein protease CpaA